MENNNYDYKEEIKLHHKEGLGASDANMLAKIENLGYVPSACYERLAIIKGLYEKEENPSTQAMAIGDEVENLIFDILHSGDNRWESNKYIESKRFSRKNLKLFCHIDYFLKDDEHKTIIFVENKATSKTMKHARYTYANQLYVEYQLGKEYAKSLGKGWKFQLKLSHYNTDGYDGIIDTDKIETSFIRFGRPLFNIDKAMDITDLFMDGFNEYYRDDIDEKFLPKEVKDKFDVVKDYIKSIKTLEKQIDEFKDRMYLFMKEKNINSIKSEFYNITKVDEGEITKFDSKKFKESHPIIYRKFIKKTKREGYVLIKLKNNKTE